MSGDRRSAFVWLYHDESIEWGRVFRRAESFKLYKRITWVTLAG